MNVAQCLWPKIASQRHWEIEDYSVNGKTRESQKMDAAAAPILSSLHVIIRCPKYPSTPANLKPPIITKPAIRLSTNIPSPSSRATADEISAITADPAQAQITWEIVIGALGSY